MSQIKQVNAAEQRRRRIGQQDLTAVTGRHHPCRTIERRTEIVAASQLCFAGRDAHPDRQLECPLRGYRRIDRSPRRRERGAHTVAGVLEQPAAVRLDRVTDTSSWAASATRIPSASASHRRVEPSMSVNRNVTAPEGATLTAITQNATTLDHVSSSVIAGMT